MKRYLLALLALATFGGADEGMWLFNNPPGRHLRQRYNFEVTPQWLDHLRLAAVRFNSGGSGSFVSPEGLVMTNHHVAADTIAKLSTKERDLMKGGFHARSREQELKAPDLELNVLVSIEDVTDRIQSAVKAGVSAAEAERSRRAAINNLEKESLDRTGLRSDVVTLYQGGQYHLYRYKKYTDVRLVFAPEKAIAFFGGDPDNFEYPRYDLDVAFFRVYENGKPARIQHYLKWSEAGAREGELIFVAGNPGRTDRLNTMTHLELLRDLDMPMRLNLIRRREVALRTYSERSLENARRAEDELFGYQNSRKARLGMLAGLQDPSLMAQKRKEQEALQTAVGKDAGLERAYGDAWGQVAHAIEAWRAVHHELYMLETGAGFNSRLFDIARALVRLAEESAKPNAERLREYAEAGLESLRQELFSEAPIYADLEIVKLADSLGMLAEVLGAEHALVRQVLEGKSPAERAAALVNGSKLVAVGERKRLAEGGQTAVKASQDPMIRLALMVDAPARAARKHHEEKVQEPMRQAYGKIARARFAVYGSNLYPDATFTLRLAFGEVRGYTENGKPVAWTTRLGGAFEHAEQHGSIPPFQLPESWHRAKGRLNLDTPFNFVSTADIIGGNSGSPVVNRQGEVVGIIFDGNIQSLVLDYLYTEEQSRALAVHSAGIVEALDKVYEARKLLEELRGARQVSAR